MTRREAWIAVAGWIVAAMVFGLLWGIVLGARMEREQAKRRQVQAQAAQVAPARSPQQSDPGTQVIPWPQANPQRQDIPRPRDTQSWRDVSKQPMIPLPGRE